MISGRFNSLRVAINMVDPREPFAASVASAGFQEEEVDFGFNAIACPSGVFTDARTDLICPSVGDNNETAIARSELAFFPRGIRYRTLTANFPSCGWGSSKWMRR